MRFRQVGRIGTFGTGLVVAAIGCVGGQVPAVDGDPRRADLTALNQWVATEASFDAGGLRTRAQSQIEELLADSGPKGEVARFLEIASVVGIADNGHSNLWSGPIYDFGVLPVRTFWFSDGLYIVRTRSEHADLLGARIDSIAGMTPNALVDRFDQYHGGTSAHFRQFFSVPWLLSPPILHAVNVSTDPESVVLSVTLRDGAAHQITLSSDRSGQLPARTAPWTRLLPEQLPGEQGHWSVIRIAATQPPMMFQETRAGFRYVFLAAEGIAYLQFRTNIDRGGNSIRAFARDVVANLERDRPRAIILDNRFNGGGDLRRTAEMAVKLPTLVPDNGAVYVLTSNATFSAGIYTSFYPKAADPARTVIVGERVGDRSRFWAESNGAFILPASGYRIGQSLEMHDIGQGCPDRNICHLGGEGKLDIAVGSLEPDVEIPWTFQDFMAGRDPALEYALATAGS